MSNAGPQVQPKKPKPPAGPPGYGDAFELGEDIVDNPYASVPDPADIGPPVPKTKPVRINVRETPVSHMFSRGEIKPELKFAADKFRQFCEAARISPAGVIDPERIRVDQSGSGSSVTDRAVAAARELARVRGRLGKFHWDLMVAVVTVGLSLDEVTSRLWPDLVVTKDSRQQKHISRCVKDALGILADHWGITALTERGTRGKPVQGRRDRFYRSFSCHDLTVDGKDWTAPAEQPEASKPRRKRR